MRGKRTKPIAVFDIDGTIFRSSLLIELNAELVRTGIFPGSAQNRVVKVREAWLNRKGSYHAYIDTIVDLYSKDIAGRKRAEIERVARWIIRAQKHRVYVYTRELIAKLRKTHTLIIISFSPIEVVRAFNRIYRFHIVSGVSYARVGDRYSGGVEEGFVLDKKKILLNIVDRHNLSLAGSIGVGDTESDIPFLEMVAQPICFNPNMNLYRYAKRMKWKVVVERKDVVYEL